jgi:hypothetical protein
MKTLTETDQSRERPLLMSGPMVREKIENHIPIEIVVAVCRTCGRLGHTKYPEDRL